jgi:dimethylhistidine N-methyltransferase
MAYRQEEHLFEDTVPTTLPAINEAVLNEALTGLSSAPQKYLSPWLFYDDAGSKLFERITDLSEYYLTRTERGIFSAHADDIFLALGSAVTLAELGAGSAAKTGILLRAATRFQPRVLYQPVDISPSALDAAVESMSAISGVRIKPQVANYITEPFRIERLPQHKVLALYIGSSIGNFSPTEAAAILSNLRQHLQPGDALLLGTDLAPGASKSVETLVAAYDDAAGVTAAFNLNVLTRLNRELGADFDITAFAHRARWNARCSRMEMHLESLITQTAHVAGKAFAFAAGETIHTENSYKFTEASLQALLDSTGFDLTRAFTDEAQTFAVTLAAAV